MTDPAAHEARQEPEDARSFEEVARDATAPKHGGPYIPDPEEPRGPTAADELRAMREGGMFGG